MTQPVLTSMARRAYDLMGPMHSSDEDNDFALANYIMALCQPLQSVEDVVGDINGDTGWSIILDIDRIPEVGFGYLAQFTGSDINPSFDGATQRASIKSANRWKRGTPGYLIAIIQAYLTGSKTVILRERDTSAYHFHVSTRTSETSGPAETIIRAAITANKAAGLQFVYSVIAGMDYIDMAAVGTYATVKSSFATYNDLNS